MAKSKKKKTAEKPADKLVLESIEAKHEFTQDEKLGLLENLSNAVHEVQSLIDQAKTSASDWKNRIKVIEGRISDLSNKATSGYELRKTECRVEFNAKKGKKTYFRLDDGEEIETRDMMPADYEIPLPMDGPKKGEPIVSVGQAFGDAFEKAGKTKEAEPEDEDSTEGFPD